MNKFKLSFNRSIGLAGLLIIFLQSCTVQRNLVEGEPLHALIEQDEVLSKAWVGVSVYDQDRDSYLFDYNSDKKFVPASNTKLLTTYASLKHLPDSIPGWYWHETADSLILYPNGDPTFFHDDFSWQPVIPFLQKANKPVVIALNERPLFSRFGAGWPWDYFQSTSVPERSQMPMYGNFAKLETQDSQLFMVPGYFSQFLRIDTATHTNNEGRVLTRSENENTFHVIKSRSNTRARPFTHHTDPLLAFKLLEDTLRQTHPHINLTLSINRPRPQSGMRSLFTAEKDTVLGIMMKRSDNFIAEQLLLMVGAELTGELTDRGAINHLLRQDLAQLPDQPSWADGSGLSRNNQFSPRFLIRLLNQMKDEYGIERVKSILPHGNQGTLSGYYLGMEDRVFAKTGTLSGTIALSGYLLADSGNWLTFSVLINHHQNSAVETRRAVEKLLRAIAAKH